MSEKDFRTTNIHLSLHCTQGKRGMPEAYRLLFICLEFPV